MNEEAIKLMEEREALMRETYVKANKLKCAISVNPKTRKMMWREL
jgi:hypothetical protein